MNIRRIAIAAAAVAITAVAGEASAQTQSVTFSVAPVNQMAVSGNPGALTINATTVGSGLTSVTDATTTWGITTNQTGTKITASIEETMPSGVTLKVHLAPPTNASSTNVTLGTTAADVVTGITKLDEAGKTITYTLSATPGAGVVASASRTVTYTVVAGS